jgi:hypothetical protein
VRRKSILDHFLVCLRTLVDRLAQDPGRVVLTLVIPLVMLVLVRLVLLWGRPRIVSVVCILPRSDARIRIMKMGGAVVKFVVSFFLVGNILALCHAMRDCAVAVKSPLRDVVIVENCRQRCCASPRTTKKTVGSSVRMARQRNGLAALVAGRPVTAPSTVVYIHARKLVTLKSRSPHIVHDHRMLYSTAPVARRCYLRFLDTRLESPARIQF